MEVVFRILVCFSSGLFGSGGVWKWLVWGFWLISLLKAALVSIELGFVFWGDMYF